MARLRVERHGTQVSWTASGTISEELAPKPYTITGMALVVRAIATTTTATWYNDPYDRIISRLNLTGRGKTFFDFSNLRVAYHAMRLAPAGGPIIRRPIPIADSVTTGDMYFLYYFHFGVKPWVVDPATGVVVPNPGDLSAGIPPTDRGNLTLAGSFAANSVMGSSVTITDGDIDIYLIGVQPEAGDPPAAYLPQALPVWSMRTPSLAATSSAFATQDNIPAGDFLHSMVVMLTRGTNTPRDDGVLNSIQVFNQLENTEIVSYGGQAGVLGDYQAAELLSQVWVPRYTPTDNVTTAMDGIASGGAPGTITVNGPGKDAGLVLLDLSQFTRQRKSGHPLYGVNMQGVSTGDLQLRYGISNITSVTMDIFYRRYQLNPQVA